MTMKKFYTEDKFGLVIDLRSMDSHDNHGSGKKLTTTNEGVQLTIERSAKGSNKINCHIFTISDSVFSVLQNKLYAVQY